MPPGEQRGISPRSATFDSSTGGRIRDACQDSLMLLSLLLVALALPPAPLGAAPSTGEMQPAEEGGEQPRLYVPARRWALVIGASEYRHLGKLTFAARDAESFAATLTARFGFEESTVRLMTDGAEDLDLRPTAGNMFLQLRRILADERLQATDLFVFYFAGHGVGEEGGDYLLPLDGAVETVTDVGLHVEDVVDELAGAGMRNVLFIVDGCRTGQENTFGAELWELAERARLAIILGCEPGQQSFEDRRLGGGVFSTHLVKALEDPKLIDEGSGALWASHVAAHVREKVKSWTSRGFDGQQVPQMWTDPTRDVLLGAELPADATTVVSAFQEAARELERNPYLAAAGRYAEMLYAAERYGEGAELLKVVEQMGELPPDLLYLMADCLQHVGRNAEMAEVLRRLREAYPDHRYTLTAIAHDLSGETSAAARYRASRRLWNEFPIQSPDLAILLAFNMVDGGPPNEARLLLEELIPQFDPLSRMGAYLAYMALVLEGRHDDALAVLERAEGYEGDYPGVWRLRFERIRLLRGRGREAEARAVLDRSIEEFPEEGRWPAVRAMTRYEDGEWEDAHTDAVRALALPLEPWSLLMAVRAGGLPVPELEEVVARQAARHPLSWQAQLAHALTMTESEAAVQEAYDAAKRLAPELGVWTATVATIRYERAREAFTRGLVDGTFFSNQRVELLSILVDRAEALGDDTGGWKLVCELARINQRTLPLVELLSLHFADEMEAGTIPRPLLPTIALAFLNGGKLESFRKVAAQAIPGSSLARDLGWAEAAWLACAGREEEARARMAELVAPEHGPLLATTRYLAAYLAVRGGEDEEAEAFLADAPPPPDDLAAALAALTHEARGEPDLAKEFFRIVIDTTSSHRFLFARIACWKAIVAQEPGSATTRTLAFFASRDGVGNPLAAELTFADEPGPDAFRGVAELVIQEGEGELAAPGASLLLTVRREGKVSGIVERTDEDVWSISGTIDEYGNLEGELKGAPKSARIFAKLAPPDLYEEEPLLREHGVLFLLLDEDARASVWLARVEL